MKPGLLVTAAAGVLLLVGGIVVFRRGPAMVDARTAEQRLAERVERFWKLRTRGDWERIHRELLAPEVRARESAEDYSRARGIIQYLAWTVDGVKIRGSSARVSSTIEVTINHPRVRTLEPSPYIRCSVQDDWTMIDGQWYYHGPVRPAPGK
jgi:hypothetical protein